MNAGKALGIFGVVGLLFIVASFSIAIRTLWFTNTAVATYGIVTQPMPISGKNGHNHFHSTISFTAEDGKEYYYTLPTHSQLFPGQRVSILYDPQNPSDARLNNFFGRWGLAIILCFVGVPFSATYIGFKWWLKPKSIPAWLEQNGQTIEADVQQIDFSGVSINGWSPFVIVAQWIDKSANSAYIFRSGPLIIDPRAYVKAGDKIQVTIDPANPRKYFVDTSFLPQVKN